MKKYKFVFQRPKTAETQQRKECAIIFWRECTRARLGPPSGTVLSLSSFGGFIKSWTAPLADGRRGGGRGGPLRIFVPLQPEKNDRGGEWPKVVWNWLLSCTVCAGEFRQWSSPAPSRLRDRFITSRCGSVQEDRPLA